MDRPLVTKGSLARTGLEGSVVLGSAIIQLGINETFYLPCRLVLRPAFLN